MFEVETLMEDQEQLILGGAVGHFIAQPLTRGRGGEERRQYCE